MKHFWVRKIVGCVAMVAIGIPLLGFVVMSLWNNILVAVIGVKAITFLQALGIFVLSKILFGGFKRGGGGFGRGRTEMKEKWLNMTPEEREQFKNDWRSRCRSWKNN
ncbi:hypothetical protein [Parasediminibacterium sp. JCM 36343]|uniref:hypothetical protein n=1 Tax=Parasediminibacterium sp. JCM 36343 TaxID=3374279 RepID=UPI00397C6C50